MKILFVADVSISSVIDGEVKVKGSDAQRRKILLVVAFDIFMGQQEEAFEIRFAVIDRNAHTCPPSALPQARRAGKGKAHVIMPDNVLHVMALEEQSVDFAKIGISDNF